MACFDAWAGVEDCNATRSYNDCVARVKGRGVCPQDTVTVEDIHDASQDCGLIPQENLQLVFPHLDKTHTGASRFRDVERSALYEFVTNRVLNYRWASEFCAKAGGSLFIPRHHSDIVSLDVFLRRQAKKPGYFWIGANDLTTEGEFRFEDGSTLFWDFFAPKQGIHDVSWFGFLRRWRRDCVAMDLENLQGYVLDCNQSLTFVCQYRPKLVPK
ncbi:C-type lectin domain family 3 member A [Elysia marginata]|uniref:C-type lectin domain family 3 member A n=1 Tax=Elysia marginata TaxID=1093978 RepID=A0AAV4JJU6_9GAST|nr:C-type lectin domain family 3 member A [Elysia marginata]